MTIHTRLHNLVGEIVELKHRVEFHQKVSETLSSETGGSSAVSSKPFVNLFAWFPLCNVFYFHKMYTIYVSRIWDTWLFLARSIFHIDHLLPPWKFHTHHAIQHISFDFTWMHVWNLFSPTRNSLVAHRSEGPWAWICTRIAWVDRLSENMSNVDIGVLCSEAQQ